MIIGLTGNSGSGKTAVSDYLSKKYAYVLDCDKIYHELLSESPEMKKELIGLFGKSIIEDNKINRKALGEIVFNNDKKLKLLNRVAHKYVIIEVEKRIASYKGDKKLIVIDAPLLIEAGLHEICDEVWVIDAPLEIKAERISIRDHISIEKAKQRLSKQMNPEELKKYADHIIENTGSLHELLSYVDTLVKI
jgi:dephospho-CoA kinase